MKANQMRDDAILELKLKIARLGSLDFSDPNK